MYPPIYLSVFLTNGRFVVTKAGEKAFAILRSYQL